MRKSLVVFTVFATSVFAVQSAQAMPFKFELMMGGVSQDPSGVVSYKALNSIDYLDLKNDAHFSTKTKPYIGFRITNSLPIVPNLKFDYMPVKFSGNGVLNRTIVFGNATYNVDTPFTLTAKMDRFDAEAYYHLPFIKRATKNMLNVKVGLDLRVVDFSENLTGSSNGQTITESKSLTVPVPMGHIGISFKPIKYASLTGDLNYISSGDNTYYNYSAGVRIMPGNMFHNSLVPFVQIGYRYEKLKINHSDVYADVKMTGPYALIGVKF